MNQFIERAKNIRSKASDLRQVVKSLPGQAAKIREAVTMTGGELHQLRADVEASIHSLRADNEDRLLTMMREVNDHALEFEAAGYELTGIDLDMALNQRLAVHLARFEVVPHTELRGLLDRQRCESVRSILSGIVKAEETAANVELSHLQYVGLVVHAGLAPTIRMEWRVLDEPEPSPAAVAPAVAATLPHATSFPPMASMFEARAMPLASATAALPVTPAPAVSGGRIKIAAPAEPAASAWSPSALDKFKKMSGTSKYG